MLQKNWKLIVVSLAAILISITVIYKLFPSYHPMGGASLAYPPEDILIKGRGILDDLDMPLVDYQEEIKFDQNEKLIRNIQQNVGIVRANDYLRDFLPGYYWTLNYTLKDDSNDEQKSAARATEKELYKKIALKFDTHAHLFNIWIDIPDTMQLPQLEIDGAQLLAENYIKKYTRFKNLGDSLQLADSTASITEKNISAGHRPKTIMSSGRIDFDFNWKEPLPEWEHKAEITAKIKGNVISDINIEYYPGSNSLGWVEIARAITTVLLMIILMILIVFLVYKKSRNYEIRFSLALKIGGLLAIFVLLEHAFRVQEIAEWENLLILFILPLFLGGSFVVLFAAGESVCREIWPDKLIPLDLIINGHLLHSHIGAGLLRGVMTGSMLFAGLLIATLILDQFLPVTTVLSGDSNLEIFGSAGTGYLIFIHSFWASVYLLTIFAILLLSALLPVLKKQWLTVLVVAVIYTFINSYVFEPFTAGIFLQVVIFAVLLWTFIRYDVLVVLTAFISYTILEFLPVLWYSDYAGEMSSYILLAAVVIPGVWGLLTRDTVTDLREIQPALAKLISERQRMKQELEIAREVQARLFPQSQPQIMGLDIAADCIPAQEVGGDYYDFIIGDDKKNLKLAIGDVSGKGTKAAFYMTLVKGFLKALARQALLPAELLRQLNSLFFENTRNDAFVSMIYAVFTLDRKEVTMARSGHNPVIHYHRAENSIETIRSEGIALGLEKGEIFNRMIEEIKIPLQNGDLFVFYTDGLTEAMNKKNLEYGEERLHKVILENKDNTARKLMEKIYQGVHNFDKGTAQHDDMTLIVVKVAME